MVISYLADLPVASSLALTAYDTAPRANFDATTVPWPEEPFQTNAFLVGRFSGERRDVGAEYYAQGWNRRPYFEIEEYADTEEGAIAFTIEWGALTAPWHVSEVPPEVRDGPWKGEEQGLWLDLEGWITLRRRFGLWLEAATTTDYEDRCKKLKTLMDREGLFALDIGEISLGLAQVKPASLYGAFVAMLCLDTATKGRMVLRCENPLCRKLFCTEKRNKKYCDSSCAAKVTKRRWWNKQGSERRRSQKEQAPQVDRRDLRPESARPRH